MVAHLEGFSDYENSSVKCINENVSGRRKAMQLLNLSLL